MSVFTVVSHVPASIPSPSVPPALFLQATHVSVESSHTGNVAEQPEWNALLTVALFEQTLHEPSE